LYCGAVVEEAFVQRSEGEVKVKALTALARQQEVKEVIRGLDQPAESYLGVWSSPFTGVFRIRGKVTYRSSQRL
jgi:hypothetical protein